jgi:endo-alpha-1,4-polygalactosaminidase (GH114 family)
MQEIEVFCNTMSCQLVISYLYIGKAGCYHLYHIPRNVSSVGKKKFLFFEYSEYGGSKFL